MRRMAVIISQLCLLWSVLLSHAWAAPARVFDPFSGPDAFYGGTPDRSAKRWIRLASTVRPTTVARPVIFFSPYPMKDEHPQVWFRLSDQQYNFLLHYTQSYRCFPRSGGDLEILEYSNGRRGGECGFGSAKACEYMETIIRSPDLNLSAPTKAFLREWMGYSFDPRSSCYAALPRNIQR